MTEYEIERLVVRLMGDAESYQKMFSDAVPAAQGAASEIERSMGRIEASSVAAGVLAAGAMQRMAGAIIDSGREVMRAWDDQENANIELRATLKANGREVEKVFGVYDEFASQIQSTTRLADEQVTALVTQAESFQLTGDAAKKAVKDAIGLAKGSAEAASGMMRVTTAMAQGDVKRAMMFSRMIPQLRGVKSETEFLIRYQKLVAAGMEAAANKANTFFGKLDQLKNVISDLYEDFGRIIGDALKPFVDRLKQGVLWLKGLSDQTKRTIAVAAGLITAFSLGSMLVMVSRAIPLFGMLGLAISTALSMIPLMLGPFGPLLALAAAGAVILVQRLGGVGAVLEAVKNAAVSLWEYVQPMLVQFGNLAKAVFDGFWSIAQTAFDNVARFVSWVWGGVGDGAQATFSNVRKWVVEALIGAEFAVRNFARIAALSWVATELSVVRLANQIVYFFSDVIPGVFRWSMENFRDIFMTSVDFVLTLFVNLGKNIRDLWTATTEWFKGNGFAFDPTPLTEGFRNTIKKLPEIAEREIGALERSLADEVGGLTKSLVVDFAAFRDERMKALGPLDGEKLAAPMNDFKESIAATTDAVTDLKDELKPDAIRYSSAKAVQAAEGYFNALQGMAGGKGKAVEGLSDALGGDGAVEPANEFGRLLKEYAGKPLGKRRTAPIPTVPRMPAQGDEARAAVTEGAARAREAMEAAERARAEKMERIKSGLSATQDEAAARRDRIREEQMAGGTVGDATLPELSEIADTLKEMLKLAEEKKKEKSITLSPVGR